MTTPATRTWLTALVLGMSLAGVREAQGSSSARYDLAAPRTCLAGWSDPEVGRQEWRVQFGVFEAEGGALLLQTALEKRGIDASHYLAVWLAADEKEPMVVVSEAVFKNAAAARAAARRWRRVGVPALVRRFTLHD